jgi:hypothetical protein
LKKLRLLPDNIPDPLDATYNLQSQEFQADMDLSAYNSIIYPSKPDVRYTKLNQAFKRLEGRLINNEHTYKRFLLFLAKFEQSMHEDESVDPKLISSVSIPILPPRKRGVAAGEDINR